nr:DNA primase [Alloscardovia omnicolens]
IRTAIERFDTQYAAGRVGAMKAVAPLIAQVRDRSLLDEYARNAARQIGMDISIMRDEVMAARRATRVYDEDAYARNHTSSNFAHHTQPDMSQPEQRLAVERNNARNQQYYRVDDAVFISEQQMMAILVQMPWALQAQIFERMSEHAFAIPVFRDLYRAIIVAGGLPGK